MQRLLALVLAAAAAGLSPTALAVPRGLPGGDFGMPAVSLGIPRLAAPASILEDELASIDALLSAGDFREARRSLDEALLREDLSDADLRQLFERLGVVELYLGDNSRARDAFLRLLLSDPDYELSPGSPKKVRELFAKVKKGFRPVDIQVDTPDSHPAGRPLVIHARIENMPGRGTPRLYYKRPAEESFRWTVLEQQEEGLSGTIEGAVVESPGALELYVEVVDPQGRRMAGAGNQLAPRRVRILEGAGAAVGPGPGGGTGGTPAPSAWYEQPLVWGIVGAAVIGGAALAYFTLGAEPEGDLPVRVTLR